VLWDTIQLLRREGGVSRQGYSLNRMIMSGTDYGGARGEKSPTNTHIDQDEHTLLWIPRHTLSSNQRARPELFQVL